MTGSLCSEALMLARNFTPVISPTRGSGWRTPLRHKYAGENETFILTKEIRRDSDICRICSSHFNGWCIFRTTIRLWCTQSKLCPHCHNSKIDIHYQHCVHLCVHCSMMLRLLTSRCRIHHYGAAQSRIVLTHQISDIFIIQLQAL